MRRLTIAAIGATALSGIAAAVVAPWSPPPPLYYESVSGYPMRVYYRNVGNSHVEVIGASGMPMLSTDTPLPQEQIDAALEHVVRQVKPSVAPSMVRPGDYMRFEIADPEELAYASGKTDKTTYFYLFAAVKMPRAALGNDKWISELCLVAETGKPFERCPGHTRVYAGT